MELLTLGVLVKKLSDFARSLRGGQWSAVLTQLLAWVLGVGAAVVFSQSDFASGVQIAGQSLTDLNFASLVLVGISAASAGGVVSDTIKAIDQTQTAALPSLLSGKLPDPAEAVRPVVNVVVDAAKPTAMPARKARKR